MIRINLLDGIPRGRAVQAKLHRGGASAFLSGREAVLGGLFLLLGAVILAAVFVFSPEEERVADSPTTVAAAEPVPAAAKPESATAATDTAPASGPEPEPAPLIVADVVQRPAPGTEPGKPTPAQSSAPEGGVAPPPAPSPGPATTPGPGWDAAARVTALEARPLGRQLEVFLGVEGGEVDISTFNLDNPGRVVVDVKNARLETRTRNLTVNHPLLKNIRIAQNLFDPPRVRLVMDVGDIPDMVIVDRSGGFVFLVTPDE